MRAPNEAITSGKSNPIYTSYDPTWKENNIYITVQYKSSYRDIGFHNPIIETLFSGLNETSSPRLGITQVLQ